MARERKPPGISGNDDFLAMPTYRLVDRHMSILEKIKSREDAEYWGHMLIGEYYPDVVNSRSASGKMAALVGLTDYTDLYCAFGYYELLKEGKTLKEAREILGQRIAKNVREFIRTVESGEGSKGKNGPRSGARKSSKVKARRRWGKEAFPHAGEALFGDEE